MSIEHCPKNARRLLFCQLNDTALLYTLPISVWPSRMAKMSEFKALIKTAVFQPSLNVRVNVKLQSQLTENFPIPQCEDCVSLFEYSGIVEAVGDIQWGLLNTSTYNLLETVSSVIIHCAICLNGMCVYIYTN